MVMDNKPTFGTHLYSALCTEAEKLGRRLQKPEFIAKADEIYTAYKKPTRSAVQLHLDNLRGAIIRECGQDPEKVTRPYFAQAGKAIKDIMAVCLDLSPEEIHRRADTYRRKHSQWELTPSSLAKWWADCGGGERTGSAKRDIYVEPLGWRPVLQNMYGLQTAAVREKQWLDLDPSMRADILQRLRNA